jgi:hypothetical protein
MIMLRTVVEWVMLDDVSHLKPIPRLWWLEVPTALVPALPLFPWHGDGHFVMPLGLTVTTCGLLALVQFIAMNAATRWYLKR